ncbi:HWE histidine kinase domain-containing protein [Cereibacter johrii]|uniref:HWE histidine kinase domain-containing protein n=1 Tax=Cereibacter johrii TaxID=445629 RepID=UPI003CF170EE
MDLDDLYRLLRVSHVQAQGIVDTIREPLLVLSGDLTVISANPAFYRTFATDRDSTIGRLLYELGNGQWNIPELRLLLENVIPKSASVADYEVQTEFPDVGQRTMLVSAQRLIHPDNGQRVLLFSIVDATARRQMEVAKDFLINELDHRIKNLMSVTQALTRQTSVEGRSAEDYRDALLGRFDALARSLEVAAHKKTSRLPDLALAAMEPHLETAPAAVIAEGPVVQLSSSQATSLGLILHELATNAAKYGALSTSSGTVTLDWEVVSDEGSPAKVHLRWQERGGPQVAAPSKTGFGTRLIKFTTEFELGGSAELSYEPDGFVAKLSFPSQTS